MKCPRCVQRIHRAAESCPQCGFLLADADARFGGDDVVLRLLTDGAGLFRKRDRDRVTGAMERFSRRFPQLFAAVYTGSVGELANLRQFGFWLLNRAAFEDLPADKPNEAGLLLTIDPELKSAGIIFGYQLDPYLNESDTFECLSRAHSYWLEGRYAEGVVKMFQQLEAVLVRRCGQARRDPESFRRRVLPPVAQRDVVRRMREGHRVVSQRIKETVE
ncbi:MAG: TPM domain-containing protein [Verrucomicrobiota bacterium]